MISSVVVVIENTPGSLSLGRGGGFRAGKVVTGNGERPTQSKHQQAVESQESQTTNSIMGNKVSLEENLIDLKIVSKQMVRSSKKCEQKEKAAVGKLKKAIQQGNVEGARIYGQDAIREKNQALNHLRMSSRLDACCSRIESAVRMNQMTGGMQGVVKGMGQSLQAMDIDKLSTLMDKFEEQFEDLDVKAGYMESTMNATTATSTPAGEVDDLISQVADENNLELGEAFSEAGPVGRLQPQVAKPSEDTTQMDLESRLANLRN